ncbi:hypothetical protein [Kitasatospora sp. NPDC002965]|uniref:hypothetical protein n=1 Tax=Kitasatospora sp. NPDC002965 TaxID=3154775 RepID=UPI0033A1461E
MVDFLCEEVSGSNKIDHFPPGCGIGARPGGPAATMAAAVDRSPLAHWRSSG